MPVWNPTFKSNNPFAVDLLNKFRNPGWIWIESAGEMAEDFRLEFSQSGKYFSDKSKSKDSSKLILAFAAELLHPAIQVHES